MPKKPIPTERLTQVFAPIRVKYKDIFDFNQFYKDFREYLIENDWGDKEEGGGDHWESYYYERIDKDGAKEYWFRWRVYKKAAQAAYIGYYLDFDWHCIAIQPAEIIRDGKKLKVNKGEIEIYIKAFLDEEYKADFNKNFILREVKKIFSKRLYHHTIEDRKKELYQEAYALQNWMKQWFKLKRYLPYEESRTFFRSRAYPSHMKEE